MSLAAVQFRIKSFQGDLSSYNVEMSGIKRMVAPKTCMFANDMNQDSNDVTFRFVRVGERSRRELSNRDRIIGGGLNHIEV